MDYLERMIAEAKERPTMEDDTYGEVKRDPKSGMSELLRKDNANYHFLKQVEALDARRAETLVRCDTLIKTNHQWIQTLTADGVKLRGSVPKATDVAPLDDSTSLDVKRHENALEQLRGSDAKGNPVEHEDPKTFYPWQYRAHLAGHAAYRLDLARLSDKYEKAETVGEKQEIAKTEEIVALQYAAFTTLCVGMTAQKVRAKGDDTARDFINAGERLERETEKLLDIYEKQGCRHLKELEADRYRGSVESAERSAVLQQRGPEVRIAPTNGVAEVQVKRPVFEKEADQKEVGQDVTGRPGPTGRGGKTR